jgi:putative hemolysin
VTVLFVLAVVTFLILVNALYVAAEFGAVGARRSRIQELADGGNWLAGRLLPMVQSPASLDRYVATCQIGITLSSLVLGAFGQATIATALAEWLTALGPLQPIAAESTAAMLVLMALTAFQVVLGELVPKSLALQAPTSAALYTVLPMRWSIWVFRWFIAVLNGSGVFLLKALRMTPDGHRHVHSPDEIELLIAESHDGGLIASHEQRRLHEALRLRLRTVRHVMVPRTSVVAVDMSWPEERILETVLRSPFSRLPVYEGSIDQVIGILYTRDLALARVQSRFSGDIRRMLRPVFTVPEAITADQVLRFFREHRTRLAIVIDEFGGMAGLVTLEDVLSDLLGDVGDEFSTPRGRPEQLPDGRFRMPGELSLSEAQRLLGTAWKSDADTLGGHVMHVLERMPVEGDRIVAGGVTIEVERLRGRAVDTLLVTPAPAAREELADG